MASTFNTFGRLIKINGSTSETASQAWTNYKAQVALGNSGNIVFADLRGANDTTAPASYPAGMYIYANGVEYKVADIVTFKTLQNDFNAFTTATDTSVKAINSSISAIKTWKDALNILVSSNKVTITGVPGEVSFSGGEYISVTTNSSTINASIADSMIARATATGRDEDEYRHLTTKGYVDTSIDAINSTISNVSTRVSKVVDDVKLEMLSLTANNASITLYQSLENNDTNTSWISKSVVTMKSDNYVTIGTESGTLTFGLTVNNNAIDNLEVTNTSLSGTGVIKSYVDRKVANLTGALRLIGTVNASNDSTSEKTSMWHILRGTDASKGNLWVANASFIYTESSTGAVKYGRSVVVESGDSLLITADASTNKPADFEIIERNLDGAVTAGTNILTSDQVVVGNGNQTVKNSGYTLGDNTSTNYASADDKLSTEKGAQAYVEGRIKDIQVIANSSSSNYLNTSAARTTDTFTITTGVNVKTFSENATAGADLADAASFKQAITDRQGTLAVATGDTAVGANASMLIALQSTNNNTSIGVHGGDYVQVSNLDSGKTLGIAVKATDLSTAATAVDGLAIASDVSAVITANEKVIAETISTIKDSVGLSENLEPQWGADTSAAYGADTSIAKVIDLLNTSLNNASSHLNSRIDNLNVTSTDAADKILVGVSESKGVISSSNATLKINEVSFTHTAGSGTVEATITGANVSVGGITTEWKNKAINTAIEDLSVMIADVSGSFLKTITGEVDMVKVSGTHVDTSFVQVSATTPVDNNVNLDTSLLLADHPGVSATGYTAAADKGLATDGWVKDYLHSILEWETLE